MNGLDLTDSLKQTYERRFHKIYKVYIKLQIWIKLVLI